MAYRIYAVRDENTGKLVNNITNPKRKYWDRKGNAEVAVRKAMSRRWESRKLKVITFELVEVQPGELILHLPRHGEKMDGGKHE